MDRKKVSVRLSPNAEFVDGEVFVSDVVECVTAYFPFPGGDPYKLTRPVIEVSEIKDRS